MPIYTTWYGDDLSAEVIDWRSTRLDARAMDGKFRNCSSQRIESACLEWMYRFRLCETYFPYDICTNRSLLLRFLPVSHRKENHEMVLTLHNLSRDIVRHTIESETFTEERHVLIGQKEADLCSSIVIPFMLAGKNNWRIVTSFCEDFMSHKKMMKEKREIHHTISW